VKLRVVRRLQPLAYMGEYLQSCDSVGYVRLLEAQADETMHIVYVHYRLGEESVKSQAPKKLDRSFRLCLGSSET
jgi:hypothetical protein